MRFGKIFPLLPLAVVLISLLLLVFAVEVLARDETVIGIVKKKDGGYIIMGEKEDYLVVGKDLSDLEGYLVQATGTVTEGTDGKRILVKRFEELQE